MAVWDPSMTGAYGLGGWNYLYRPNPLINEYVNKFTSSVYSTLGTPNNYIESGSAFLVKATTPGSVTIGENAKATGSHLASFTGGVNQTISANLHLANGTLLDGITAQYDETFSTAIDGYDIHKMHTLGEEVSLKSAEGIIVIGRRAMMDLHDTLRPVSYTHLDVYKRQTIACLYWVILNYS